MNAHTDSKTITEFCVCWHKACTACWWEADVCVPSCGCEGNPEAINKVHGETTCIGNEGTDSWWQNRSVRCWWIISWLCEKNVILEFGNITNKSEELVKGHSWLARREKTGEHMHICHCALRFLVFNWKYNFNLLYMQFKFSSSGFRAEPTGYPAQACSNRNLIDCVSTKGIHLRTPAKGHYILKHSYS